MTLITTSVQQSDVRLFNCDTLENYSIDSHFEKIFKQVIHHTTFINSKIIPSFKIQHPKSQLAIIGALR